MEDEIVSGLYLVMNFVGCGHGRWVEDRIGLQVVPMIRLQWWSHRGWVGLQLRGSWTHYWFILKFNRAQTGTQVAGTQEVADEEMEEFESIEKLQQLGVNQGGKWEFMRRIWPYGPHLLCVYTVVTASSGVLQRMHYSLVQSFKNSWVCSWFWTMQNSPLFCY